MTISNPNLVSAASIEESGYVWLLESTFLNQLDADSRDRLLALMEWRDYNQDAVLVTAGQPGGGVDLIVEGEAQVLIPATGGSGGDTMFSRFATRTASGDSVVARLAPGHIYGEGSLFKGTPAVATVRALSPIRSLHLSVESFHQALADISQFRDYIGGLVELRDRSTAIADLLLRHPFLRLLGRDDIQRFVESGRIVRVGAAASVVRHGERTTEVYVVIRGRVCVMGGQGRSREIIATKGPGWVFGQAAALLGSPRTADIETLEPTELLQVPATVLMGLVTRNPALYRQLYQEMAVSGVQVAVTRASAAGLMSVYGTRPGLGTTSIAWGLAAALARELGVDVRRDTPRPDWPAAKVVLVDLGGAALRQRLGLAAREVLVGDIKAEEILPPDGEAWPMRVLHPYTEDGTLELVRVLRVLMPAEGMVVVASASQSGEDKRVLHEANSVVLVRSSSDGSHGEAAERHQYRVDAIRLTGGVISMESAGRAVRVPDDREAVLRFEHTGDVMALATDATLFGRASGRLVRALLGRSVGLALGGGGALGFAHIGLIRALEEARIPIDYVAGVSFGSVVAGMYAAGRREAIERVVHERWKLLPTLGAGFVTTQGFEWLVRHWLGGDIQMSDTEIPFFPVGVDVHTGREVVRSHGSIGHGIRSSSCLPGAFPALVVGNQRIVDGGMHNNVPASVTWQAGAHFIIASNIIPEFPFAPPSRKVGVRGDVVHALRGTVSRFDDLMRSLFLLMSQSGRDRAQLADYVFDLEVHGFNIYDFARGDQIARAGYEQAKSVMPDIETAWHNQAVGVASAPQSKPEEPVE